MAQAMEKLAAVSVDLDEIDCYAAIHGLTDRALLSERARRAVYLDALPRLRALFAKLEVPVTFFAIGRDLVHADNRAALRRLTDEGHEIANHTLNHFYDLTRRPLEEQRAEVKGGADAIEAATGQRPVGFRSPGYTITDELFEVLEGESVKYDASVFACPSYYAAKAVAMAGIALRGRQSRSVMDHPRVLRAPADPYRVGHPFHRRGQGLLELPVGVTSTLTARLPYIGTSLILAGERGARTLSRMMGARAFVSLELHGIDVADAEQDGLTALAAHQPDLRKSGADKERILTIAIETLREQGYRFTTLREAAERYSAA